jgi:hypothetical protein
MIFGQIFMCNLNTITICRLFECSKSHQSNPVLFAKQLERAA